jgi:hypothetical protein
MVLVLDERSRLGFQPFRPLGAHGPADARVPLDVIDPGDGEQLLAEPVHQSPGRSVVGVT